MAGVKDKYKKIEIVFSKISGTYHAVGLGISTTSRASIRTAIDQFFAEIKTVEPVRALYYDNLMKSSGLEIVDIVGMCPDDAESATPKAYVRSWAHVDNSPYKQTYRREPLTSLLPFSEETIALHESLNVDRQALDQRTTTLWDFFANIERVPASSIPRLSELFS